jgi:hypothetical protein
MSEGGADEDAARRRASTPFDPYATARVLGEIQAEGLRAAGALVERLVHIVDGPVTVDSEGDTGPTVPPLPNSPADAQAATDAWFSMWNELFERTTRAFGAPGAGPAPAGPAGERSLTIDGPRSGSLSSVVADVTPGTTTSVEVWLHNGTAEDLGPLAPVCGPLTASDGSVLDAVVTIDPAQIAQLPRRSSRGLQVTIAASTDLATGRYRGALHEDGAPDLWLAVEVVVGGAA